MKMSMLAAAVTLLLLSPAVTHVVLAQSQDRDNPTRLSSNEISGTSTTNDKREFWYAFTVDPGEFSVTLDVEGAIKTMVHIATVWIELYDQNSNRIDSFYKQSGNSGEKERLVKRYNIAKRMPVLMRMKFGGEDAGAYTVRLGGISLGQAGGAATQPASAIDLPKTGTLTIRMRDGSVHTIDLSAIQDAKIAR